MNILYLHGLGSKPGGVKPTYLARTGHVVTNPALPDADFGESVAIARLCFELERPDVVIGSSRGGAVALAIATQVVPVVLIAPAWKKWGTAVRAARETLILHSGNDSVIPIEQSRELLRNSDLAVDRLIEVGEDHNMIDPQAFEALTRAIESLGSKGMTDVEEGIIDISPLVDASLAVWPGDTRLVREVLFEKVRGDSVTLSTLHATVHLGAHADARSHFLAQGGSIETAELSDYIGRCEVVAVKPLRGGMITLEHIPKKIEAERVLFRTDSFPDPRVFNTDFAAIDPDLVDELALQGVRLVGIDTPSVDRFNSRDLLAHHALGRNGIAILEGLALANVEPGVYELIALPLRLSGFDASPVRAVLRRRT